MSDERTRHDRLLDRIARGERIEARDEMSGTYRDSLVHLMTMQADSELAGAYGYVPWIMKAPGVEEKLVVAQIVKDETRHAKVMYDLLEELGQDVAGHVGTHDQSFARRLDDSEADIGTARVASDKRVNIFYYPINTWFDFIVFNFCMDRGAGHQLEDSLHCSYKPWADVMEGIFKEEAMHMAHGDWWVKKLAADPETKDEAQEALNTWFPRTMNIFGRPNSPKNQVYRKLGIKKRDNEEVRQAFAAEIRSKCDQFGLKTPEWKPIAKNMTEEPFIPG